MYATERRQRKEDIGGYAGQMENQKCRCRGELVEGGAYWNLDLESPELGLSQDQGEPLVASEAVGEVDLALVADLQALDFDFDFDLAPALGLELPDSSE